MLPIVGAQDITFHFVRPMGSLTKSAFVLGARLQIHCIEPVMGSTIGIVTELPVMLIKLAVLPVGLCRAQRGAVSEHGRDRRRSVGARASNEGGFEEVVVAVAGVVGRIQLVGIKVSEHTSGIGSLEDPSTEIS